MKLPKLAVIAVAVALLATLLDLIAAYHHLFLIAAAVVPVAAAISIMRKRVWGAYGFALFEGAQACSAVLLAFSKFGIPKTQVIATVCASFAVAALFFFAGRALGAAGAKRGSSVPWIVVTCISVVPLFFIRSYVVPTGAMENTLQIGDKIVARTFPRPNPKDGDLVIFRYPIDPRQLFIKRVIGVPGDRIRVSAGVVYRNGVALHEPYVIHKFGMAAKAADNLPHPASSLPTVLGPAVAAAFTNMIEHHNGNDEVVVPAGNYFVLGDNRDNSLDSRYWGFLPASDVIGEPFLVYDSVHKDRLFHWL